MERAIRRQVRRFRTVRRLEGELQDFQKHVTDDIREKAAKHGETVELWITSLRDIQVYRRALGYEVPPETPATLSDGTIPRCQRCDHDITRLDL